MQYFTHPLHVSFNRLKLWKNFSFLSPPSFVFRIFTSVTSAGQRKREKELAAGYVSNILISGCYQLLTMPHVLDGSRWQQLFSLFSWSFPFFFLSLLVLTRYIWLIMEVIQFIAVICEAERFLLQPLLALIYSSKLNHKLARHHQKALGMLTKYETFYQFF
jgi:hypothetical protein